MKKFNKISIISLLLLILFSFNAFAMTDNKGNYVFPTPQNEERYESKDLNYRWAWIDNELCVRFKFNGVYMSREVLKKRWELGALSRWVDRDSDKNGIIKTRETYSGKWSQSADGIWSFTFDDYTIPVGVTKIDGVLYAFNTYGEIGTGYEYYTGFKTEADGLVKADSAEFTQWLTTQYLPECTSHE